MRNLLWIAVLVVIALVVARSNVGGNPWGPNKQTLKYSEFLQRVDDGTISEVVVERLRAHGKFDTGEEFKVELPPSETNTAGLVQTLTGAVKEGRIKNFETPN